MYGHVQVTWPYRLMARTAPSHGVNRGSTPRRVTNEKSRQAALPAFLICEAAAMFGQQAEPRGGVEEILERRRENYP